MSRPKLSPILLLCLIVAFVTEICFGESPDPQLETSLEFAPQPKAKHKGGGRGHIKLTPTGHHDHTGTPKEIAVKLAKKAEQKVEKEIKESNAKPICNTAFIQAQKACTSRMDRSPPPTDREIFERVSGVSKISEAHAHNHHHEGDLNANYAGECRGFAGHCLQICNEEKSPEANSFAVHCKTFDKHADHHETIAIMHYENQIKSYQIAMSTAEDQGDNSDRGSGSPRSSTGSGQSEASSGSNNGGFGSMADRMAAFQQGRAFLREAFGNNDQGSMSAQSINPSFGAEPQYQQDLQATAGRDLRNSGIQESTDLQQAEWSNPSLQNEVSNSNSASGYQPASANSLGGGGRIPSSGTLNAASNSGGSSAAGGGLPGRAAANANSGGGRNEVMPYEPMYRMIKVGNVDAASGNGSSEGRQQAKTINLNDYLPNGSQYQNGYSPSGMDVLHHEIQPQATNIWGLISDRTRTLCAQKRLYDCNGH